MRRAAALTLALLTLAPATQAANPPSSTAAPSGPPHAWLFGSWTGGLFPTSGSMAAQACLAQPTVIFTRDVVLRGSLTEPTYGQRVIETARTNPGITDFRFAPAVDAAAATGTGLLGIAQPKAAGGGFGCESADVLHVQRRSDNEIIFPGCTDFPEPLVRCPAR